MFSSILDIFFNTSIRIKADRKYLSSAKRMAERYNSTLSFVISESVPLRIRIIDGASSDLSRLPCVVVDIVGGDQSLYRLSMILLSIVILLLYYL